jgi:multimeric flavodoxin WrbA
VFKSSLYDWMAQPLKSLLIVYHSQSGASAQLAKAAWRGARMEAGIEVAARRVWDTGTGQLLQADGLMLVAAENSGAVSGGMKDFLDRTFYPAIEHNLVLPYTLLVSAGNDGRGAVGQVQRILSGYPFPAAAQPVILRGEVTAAHLQTAGEMGQAFAAGLVMGIF